MDETTKPEKGKRTSAPVRDEALVESLRDSIMQAMGQRLADVEDRLARLERRFGLTPRRR